MARQVVAEHVLVATSVAARAQREYEETVQLRDQLESFRSSLDGHERTEHNDYVYLLRHIEELNERLRDHLRHRVSAYNTMSARLTNLRAEQLAAQPAAQAVPRPSGVITAVDADLEPERPPRRRRIRRGRRHG